jgi:hypothetical protein
MLAEDGIEFFTKKGTYLWHVYVLEKKLKVARNAPITFTVAKNAETRDATKVVLNHDVQIKPLFWPSVCNVAHMGRRNNCDKAQKEFVIPSKIHN